jgi:CheY-like chemotaxis protein
VGTITIETGRRVFDEAYCANHVGFKSGDYVRLAISDNGSGMDKETLAHIFEPFFTTKDIGKGTGLGLATVYGIVKQNDGFVNVYSEPARGTIFTIYLPRYGGTGIQVQPEKPAESILGGQETILLVEDDPAILEMTTQMLEGLGYAVLAANSPDQAIQLAREHSEGIHLLMTDVIMPEMNGRDLSTNLVSLSPHLKCLFMSGYTADIIAPHGVLDAGVSFIQKPFSTQELALIVRKVLDGAV